MRKKKKKKAELIRAAPFLALAEKSPVSDLGSLLEHSPRLWVHWKYSGTLIAGSFRNETYQTKT